MDKPANKVTHTQSLILSRRLVPKIDLVVCARALRVRENLVASIHFSENLVLVSGPFFN